MSTTGARIAKLIDSAGLTPRKLQEKLGVSNVSIYNWMNDLSAPRGKNLNKFCEYFNVDPSWLLFGTGESQTAPETGLVRIPLMSIEASCGGGSSVDGEAVLRSISVSDSFLRTYARGANPASLNIITVRGDSMTPTLESGDSVIVDTSDQDVSREGMFVIQMGGGLYVKRIQITPRGINLLSDNTKYPPIEVGEQDFIKVIGRVHAGALIRSLI